jgi:hypothetical protein
MAIEMPIEAGTSETVDFRLFLFAASTHLQSRASFPYGYTTSERWVALTKGFDRSHEVDDAIRVFHALVPKRTIEEVEVEEREWDSIVNKAHVRQALRRLATEARRQYYTGETEEGGFGLE